jgi:hypothetical protein
MIIFVHLPKSGGTSFRQIMINHFNDNETWVDYSNEWTKSKSGNAKIPKSAKFICGHIQADAFLGRFPDSKLITWLRDPLDRTLSLYNHITSRTQMENNPEAQYVIDNNLTLQDFIELPWTHNYSLNFINNVPLKSFFHIGFCHQYQKSLDILSDKLTLSHRLTETWENKSKSKFLNIDKSIRNKIINYNEEEYNLYNKAHALFG